VISLVSQRKDYVIESVRCNMEVSRYPIHLDVPLELAALFRIKFLLRSISYFLSTFNFVVC
jgi:hypothetical protein